MISRSIPVTSRSSSAFINVANELLSLNAGTTIEHLGLERFSEVTAVTTIPEVARRRLTCLTDPGMTLWSADIERVNKVGRLLAARS
jgi:hypothetical protein